MKPIEVRYKVTSSGLIYREDLRGNKKSWVVNRGCIGSHGYRHVRMGNAGHKLVHRLIWERFRGPIPQGFYIDHINRNRLDNRLENLRLVTGSQNSANSFGRLRRKAKFKGVVAYGNRWAARIKWEHVSYHLGYFATEEDAAKAYDRKALELSGEHAYLNFKEIV